MIRRRLVFTLIPNPSTDYPPIHISVAIEDASLLRALEDTPVVGVNYEIQMDLSIVNPAHIHPIDDAKIY